jgi:hypothetical protein
MNHIDLIEAVHQHFNIDPSLRTRRREVVDARSALMVALRPHFTTNEIARMFTFETPDGKVKAMSHCSVVHAEKLHAERYHSDPAKRIKHYELYCDIFDFANSYLGEEYHKPITQIDMRQAIKREVQLREEAEAKVQMLRDHLKMVREDLTKELEELSKQMKKLTSERDKIKAAFSALYNEKKAQSAAVNFKQGYYENADK